MDALFISSGRLFWMAACLALLTFNIVAQVDFDLVIRKVQIYDGSGNPPIIRDVAIQADHIIAIGKLNNYRSKQVISGRGLTLCPGFIDLHSHADDPLFAQLGLRADAPALRMAHNLVMQGVTTVVVNQDGRSPVSLRAQRQQLEKQGFGPNVILMVGHNSIRHLALGGDYQRHATPGEILRMQESLLEGLEAGAFGLTAGLEYVPGRWSHPEELMELAKVLAARGGVYIVHERASGSDPMWYWPSQSETTHPTTMLDNVHEVIDLAEKTKVPSCITHIKARGMDYWGKSGEMVALINAARARGVNIWADQYPYNTSGSDGNTVLLPPWSTDLMHNASEKDRLPLTYQTLVKQILSDDEKRHKLLMDVQREIIRRGGPEQIIITEFPDDQYLQMSLKTLASRLQLSVVETVFWLQEKGFQDRPGGATLRAYSLSEEDVINFMRQPWCMTASDGGLTVPDGSLVHSRYYGTFPRKIAFYARDKKVLGVAQAIHSSTGLPANFLGLKNRGYIKPGYKADLVLFDLKKLEDRSTFKEPHQYPTGIRGVWINGVAVVKNSKLVQAYPGRVIDHRESSLFN